MTKVCTICLFLEILINVMINQIKSVLRGCLPALYGNSLSSLVNLENCFETKRKPKVKKKEKDHNWTLYKSPEKMENNKNKYLLSFG